MLLQWALNLLCHSSFLLTNYNLAFLVSISTTAATHQMCKSKHINELVFRRTVNIIWTICESFRKYGNCQTATNSIPVAMETGSVPKKWQLITFRGSSIGVGKAASEVISALMIQHLWCKQWDRLTAKYNSKLVLNDNKTVEQTCMYLHKSSK